MTGKLVLVHTVPPLIETFSRLGAELLPGVKLVHILDEPLLEQVSQRGELAEADSERLLSHLAHVKTIYLQPAAIDIKETSQ